ncbi:MAG TPA: Kazal-type serine protease inhibitor family protein [Polyangia bacterium]|jgi:hypothetical protein
MQPSIVSSDIIFANLCSTCSPWGYTRNGIEAVLYLDTNLHVHEVAFESGVITSDTDFTNEFGAPVADFESPTVPDIIGYLRADGRSAMVYRSGGQVIEILSDFGHQPAWVVNNLTIQSGATVTVKLGSAFPYVRTDGWTSIVYAATDNHIHEIATLGHGWGDWDLSARPAPTVVPATGPWAYQRSDHWNSVVFVGTDGQLHELAYLAGPSWGHWVFPVASPGTVSNRRPSGYVRTDLINSVIYTTTSNELREQALTPGSQWQDWPLPLPANYVAVSEPFGMRRDGWGSVLFAGQDVTTGDVKAVELYLPFDSNWTSSIIEASPCGGPQHTSCSAGDAFCELAPGACATTAPTGVCLRKPHTCDPTVTPVCACDGKTYANDCERAAAGVPKWTDGRCSDPTCPASAPQSGATCTQGNIACVFSITTGPNAGCVQRFACTSGTWSAAVVVCDY